MRDLFKASFEHYRVSEEWQNILRQYMVHGFHPGSFFEAMLSNDFFRMAVASHNLNDWGNIMAVGKWLLQVAPTASYGSPEKVQAWMLLTNDERRAILEKHKLLATMWDILSEPA